MDLCALSAIICVFTWLPGEALGQTPRPDAVPDTLVRSGNGFEQAVRCSTRAPLTAEVSRANAEVEQVLARMGRAGRTEIPVVVHVLKRSRRKGDVSDERIAAQIDVLNAAFKKSRIRFRLEKVNRVRSKRWSRSCTTWWIEEEMKASLAVRPNTTLNIYTCDPDSGALGYATFPWEFDDQAFMRGVVINYETLPGGKMEPYNEGDTAVHEVGHYLGLFHTFENGCAAPGDEIADTAPESRPAFGCPISRRSCGGGKPDPVQNFMNYSDDACMDEFTKGQSRRMTGFTKILGLGGR